MSSTKHRLQALRGQENVNGIDFVEVLDTSQKILRVHFVNASPRIAPPDGVAALPVRIEGGDTAAAVSISRKEIKEVDDREVLEIEVKAPGDFSLYTLFIDSDKLDRFFREAPFSFKVLCKTSFDCEAEPPARADETPQPIPIDYLAKDFASFKNAMLEYSAQRYPDFRERSEADLGIVLAEVLAAVADDLSYTQDRVAQEATLGTATERRSIVRHARMVDYEPAPPISARAWLRLEVNEGTTKVPSGLAVFARASDGQRIGFETGEGLSDPAGYPVDPRYNELSTYYWDESTKVLSVGATEIWLDAKGLDLGYGHRLLLDTAPAAAGGAPVREIVRIQLSDEHTDVLYKDNDNNSKTVTRVILRDALRFEHALNRTVCSANLVPATQGITFTESFAIETGPTASSRLALARIGAEGAVQHIYPLDEAPLAWLASPGSTAARAHPEAQLVRKEGAHRVPLTFYRSLLDAEAHTEAFTVDPMRYRPVGRMPSDVRWFHYDYDGDNGDSLRLGDGTFGASPDAGDELEVRYRTTAGEAGNVPADAITITDPGSSFARLASAVSNPLPAEGGADREPAATVQQNAPQAFRARMLRAIRPDDYRSAAEELTWVQRAGTRFRHTGSWVCAFTAIDPRASTRLTTGQKQEVTSLLDRRRLAGRESIVVPPTFLSLDLEIEVCARPDAFRGDVEEVIVRAIEGFFLPDRLTFGSRLYRSALEAAIDRAHGVDGVRFIRYRQRGKTPTFVSLPAVLDVGPYSILRVDNDPSHAERGSIKVIVEGGK
jgi:hypothetical protein